MRLVPAGRFTDRGVTAAEHDPAASWRPDRWPRHGSPDQGHADHGPTARACNADVTTLGPSAGSVIRCAGLWRFWLVPPSWLAGVRRGPRWPGRTARAGPFRRAGRRP